MKTFSPIFLALLLSTIASAQEPEQKSVTVSIGGGRTLSSSSLKQEVLIGNGTQLGADVYIPLFRKGWDGTVKGGSKFTVGIIAGGNYQSADNLSPDASPLQSKYKLPTGDLEITNMQNGAEKSKAMAFFAGLQADFTVGRITMSPSVSGGYSTIKQDGFIQSSQVMINGKPRTIVLSSAENVKSSGVIIIPQFKVGYRITRNFSFYAAGAVNAGPAISSAKSYLVPSGGFNDKHTYEATQLASGTLSLDGGSKDPAYFTTSIQAGVSFSIGRSKAKARPKTALGTGGGGAASASYAATGRVVNNVDTTRSGKQTQGATFGEKVNAGLHAAGSAVAQGASLVLSPGTPIGGIIVKGGKNPGGSLMTVTTDNSGQFELNIREAGDYLFILTAPVNTNPENKSVSKKGKKSDNPLYEDNGHAVDNPLHNPGAIVLSPGNPIGGIIVKGGKNPGGSNITVVSNDKGEIIFKGLEAGTYLFSIATPASKSINEKGVKRTEN